MEQFTLKKEFKSVQGKDYLHDETETDTVALKIPAGGFDPGKSLRVKGFGNITKNDSSIADRLDMVATVLVIQGETATAVDVPIYTVANRRFEVAENFEFEIQSSYLEGDITSYLKSVFTKSNQDAVTEVTTGSGGSVIGSIYEANIRFKHSVKSKPESEFKVQGLTIELLG